MSPIDQVVNISIAFLAAIPAKSFYSKFQEFKLKEFLYMSLIFACTSLTAFGAYFSLMYDELIFYQLQHISLQTIYFVIFLMSLRMYFHETPPIIKYIAYVWYISLITLTLLWEKMVQESSAKVLFWTVNKSSSERTNGAGISYGDTIIYSTAYNLLVILFIGYCLLWFFFALQNISPVIKSSRIRQAHLLWKIAIFINILWVIVKLPWTIHFQGDNGLVVVMLIIIAYIIYSTPEGMLLSNAQITKSYSVLVEMDDKLKHNELSENSTMKNFHDYIKLILDSNIIEEISTT